MELKIKDHTPEIILKVKNLQEERALISHEPKNIVFKFPDASDWKINRLTFLGNDLPTTLTESDREILRDRIQPYINRSENNIQGLESTTTQFYFDNLFHPTQGSKVVGIADGWYAYSKKEFLHDADTQAPYAELVYVQAGRILTTARLLLEYIFIPILVNDDMTEAYSFERGHILSTKGILESQLQYILTSDDGTSVFATDTNYLIPA